MPIGNRHLVRLRCDPTPKGMNVFDLLLDRQVVETGRRNRKPGPHMPHHQVYSESAGSTAPLRSLRSLNLIISQRVLPVPEIPLARQWVLRRFGITRNLNAGILIAVFFGKGAVGKVDFPAVLAAIEDIGFQGYANLETGAPSAYADSPFHGWGSPPGSKG